MLGYSLAGLVVGLAVGATGVGGGSLMTPILILFYGISPAIAVGTDLLYASISKAFAVVLHGKNGSVDWQIVGRLSLGSVPAALDRKSTRLNSSHSSISYAVFCLKKKKKKQTSIYN